MLELKNAQNQPERWSQSQVELGMSSVKNQMFGQVWWLTPINLALGKLGQEDCWEFKTSLCYIGKPVFKRGRRQEPERWLIVKKSTCCFFQRTCVQFPACTWWLSILTPVSRERMPSSGLCSHQTCKWYTYVHFGKTFIHIKITPLFLKRLFHRSTWLLAGSAFCYHLLHIFSMISYWFFFTFTSLHKFLMP